MSNENSYGSVTSTNGHNFDDLAVRPAGLMMSSTTTQVIRNKFEKLKTLVLKLKPNNGRQDLASFNPDQLDQFVDEIIGNLQNSLLFNANDLRERIKQARPDPHDPLYENRMTVYKELLAQMISIMHKLHSFIALTLDELHVLVIQLWDDISKNNGKQVERLLEEHEHRIEAHLNEKWMKGISELERKLQAFSNVDYGRTQF